MCSIAGRTWRPARVRGDLCTGRLSLELQDIARVESGRGQSLLGQLAWHFLFLISPVRLSYALRSVRPSVPKSVCAQSEGEKQWDAQGSTVAFVTKGCPAMHRVSAALGLDRTLQK